MTPKRKANLLIEQFYQNAPIIMGTGQASYFGSKMAMMVTKHLIKELPEGSERHTFYKEVYDYLKKIYGESEHD